MVRAGIEPGDAILDTVACSEDQHRQRQLAAAPAAQPDHAVTAGQAQVEHHRVIGGVHQSGVGLRSISEPVDHMAKLAQAGRQGISE